MAEYRASDQSASGTADERELIAAAIDAGSLTAFHEFAAAEEALDAAVLRFADAAGHAARTLGLDLAELLGMLSHRACVARGVSDRLALRALAAGETG